MDYSLIEAIPANCAVLLPEASTFTVVAASRAFVLSAGVSKEMIIERSFFEVFSKNADVFNSINEDILHASFNNVLQTKQPDIATIQVQSALPTGSSSVEKFLKAHNVPVLGEDGEVKYIIYTIEDVTEQIKAEQKVNQLKDIQRDYNLFMEAPVAICIVNGADYVVELANEHMLQLMGRTAAVAGLPIEQSLPEAKAQGLLAILDWVRKTGESYRAPNFPAEIVIDGVRYQRYFDLVFQPYLKNNSDKKFDSIFCAGYNVTAQVQAQKKLEAVQTQTEKQKRLYDAILDSTPDLVYVFDLNYSFTYANDALLKMWGKTFEEAVGKKLLENGYEPWHAEMHEREIDTVVATKQPIRGEVSFPHATLGRRVYDYIFVPVFTQEGEVEAVAGTTRDITEIKRAEQSLRESEQRFRNLADESPMFVFIIDADPAAPVDYWNKTWLQYTGLSLEEAVGTAWDEIIHPNDLSIVMENYLPAFENKQSYFIPAVRVKRFDGAYRWHAFKGNPRYLDDGVFNGFVGVGLDIHDQKEAEEALRQSELQLQQKVAERTAELQKAIEELKLSNANLEDFAYAASHDLKEPVRKFHFFANRLKSELQDSLNETQKHLFDRLNNASKRMDSLIDDLLTYSQVTKAVSELEEVDLNKKVEFVLEDLELEIEQKNATITVDQLPVIKGNKRQMQQLFQNLLGNALKYNKPELTPEIQISCTKIVGKDVEEKVSPEDNEKTFYMLKVKDNGIGFNQEYAARIFNLFTRLHNKDEYKGTGVGLSIAKKVVENHHGKIWAESKPGEGATFTVLLPCD